MAATKRLFVAIESGRNRCLGTLLRCASAFGAAAVLVVGSPHYSTHGAHGAQKYIQVLHFFSWPECVEFLRSQNCSLFGLCPSLSSWSDVTPSTSVHSVEADRSIALLLGPKNNLTSEIISIADCIIHVPVPNIELEEFVHYDAKVSICLQHFACQAALPITDFRDGKHHREMQREIFHTPKRQVAQVSMDDALEEGFADLFS